MYVELLVFSSAIGWSGRGYDKPCGTNTNRPAIRLRSIASHSSLSTHSQQFHLLALALRDLREAAKLASDCPDVLARLAHLKQYMHYVRLRHEHDNTRDKDRRKELTLAALRHAYRTRYSYMNHWEAMRQSWTRKAASEFEEPSRAFN